MVGILEASSANPNGLILDAAAVTEYAMRVGYKKTHMTFIKTCMLAVLAGVYVSFGSQTFIGSLQDVEFNGPTKLLAGTFFAFGLMVIILCGAELFTGNVLIFVAVLSKRVFLWEYIFDLFVVYFSNFFGIIVFGVLFWGSGVNGFDNHYTASGIVACRIATSKAHLPEYQALLRGIGANMCVCFAILMAYASKTVSGKVLASIFPIAAFGAMGFEHCIANMYFFTAATLLRCPGFKQQDAWGELFLCTAGNLIGAMFLAASYWYINIHGTNLELQAVPCRRVSTLNFFPHSAVNRNSFAGPPSESAHTAEEMSVGRGTNAGVVHGEPYTEGQEALTENNSMISVKSE